MARIKSRRSSGTVFNTKELVSPLAPKLAALERMNKGALVRYNAARAYADAKQQTLEPSPEMKWLRDNWPVSANEKLFFVTDGDWNFVRNTARNYIVDIEGRLDLDRTRYLKYTRKQELILVKAFDLTSLELAKKRASEILSA